MGGEATVGSGRGKRAALAAAACAVIAAAALAGPGSGESAAGPAPAPPDPSRIAWVRVYQDNKFIARGETPESIGAALAELRPTYVTSLIRYAAGERVRAREVAAWNTIREAVLATSPQAEFAIELNALQYPTVRSLNAMMARVRARYDNEGWLFDFYTTQTARKPGVMAAAVTNAHANGEWIGGNAFGIGKSPKFPPGTDFLEVQDFGFRIDLDAVRELSERVPVHFHLGNSPGFPSSDGCVFIKGLSTLGRRNYVTRRAAPAGRLRLPLRLPGLLPGVHPQPQHPAGADLHLQRTARRPDDGHDRRAHGPVRLTAPDPDRALGSCNLEPVERQATLVEEVSGWEGVTVAPGRFGSTRFMVGRRELGHLHGETTLDMPLPPPMKAELIERGEARQHRWAKPDSGWVTIELEPGPAGVERGVALLRERYEHARSPARG